MFSRVSISNFKSIKRLEFEPRRVNVLIGEPNTGKSNVLEALSVFCVGIYKTPETLRDVLRFATLADLFYDRELSENIVVITDNYPWTLGFQAGVFRIHLETRPVVSTQVANLQPTKLVYLLDHQGVLQVAPGKAAPKGTSVNIPLGESVRYYRYRPLANFSQSEYGALEPPHGANLAAVLTTNKSLRRLVSDLFRARGFRLVINPERNELLLAKDVEDQLYQFSYPTISETLRRIVFYMAVFETNQNAILLLDEPEANTFPFYTTYLAERIALDETNQYFLTTHNPYILGSIVAKTPARDLSVFVTTMESYQTRLTRVTDEGLSRIMEYGPDAFLNLDRLATA